jgi:hypothetical protein
MATRYQRGNQNPYIEEEQTTQWPQEKVQKDKQRSTKHKTKDRVTRTPLTTGVNFFFDIRILITSLWYLQTFLEDTKAVNGRQTDNTMNTSKKTNL